MIAALAVMCVACQEPTVPVQRSTSVEPTTNDQVFRVGATQARLISTVLAFFDAWNAGDDHAISALVVPNFVGGDCDRARHQATTWSNREEFLVWFRARAHEHDRLEVATILNENADPETGSRVVAIDFVRRTSDVDARGPVDAESRYGLALAALTADGRQLRGLNLPGAGAGQCR